jgi:hypothetical protein
MALITYVSAVVAISVALQLLYSKYKAYRLQQLPHIPTVKFEENDTQSHYITSSRELMLKGYEQVLLSMSALVSANIPANEAKVQ